MKIFFFLFRPGALQAVAEWFDKRLIVLFFIPFVVYMSNVRELSSGDTTCTKFVAIFLAQSGTIYLDNMKQYFEYNELPYFLSVRDGHVVSNYPIFPGIMATPFYAPFVWMGMIRPGEGNLVWDYISKLCASTYTSLSVLFLYLTFKRLLNIKSAFVLAYAYAFGTAAWPIASQSIWQHTGAIFWWSVCFYATIRADDSASPNRWKWLALAGTAAGCTVLCRIVHLTSAGFYAAVILWRYRKSAIAFLLPCGILTAMLIAYNYAVFDTWNGGLAYVLADRWHLDRVQGGVWSTPLFEGLAGVLISPSRGVFAFSPFLLFSLLGMFLLWKRSGAQWQTLKYMLPIPIGLLCVFGKYIVWWGGIMHYGPRYQVDAYPFLMLCLAAAWPEIEKRRWMLTLFVCLLLYSVWVQWVGAFCFPGNWAVWPVSLSDDKARLWEWSYNQIWESFYNGVKHPMSQ
ncbi:MAG: hypothetical protein P9L94_08145 [Candidatus Hinthialibacter antarcticus]|nr:hypothetical protein [Candidatus Hinthialibacter antarcticus]